MTVHKAANIIAARQCILLAESMALTDGGQTGLL